jgi:ABC-2 type transport system ATP-binding protein
MGARARPVGQGRSPARERAGGGCSLDVMVSHPLSLVGVVKRFPGDPPVTAVAGIDLEVAEREVLGLLGPNGAGKSTTIGIITTRVRPTAGDVRVFGIDAVREPARVKATLGVVQQANTLDRRLTLRENLYYHCRYFGMAARESHARADELLERFRLADRRDAMPMAISGGMAQRLQIARAVAHRPSLLLLDEPTAGLDPQSRIALWELVGELRDDGITVVVSTHYMEEADVLCDRVAIIDHGRILVVDTPQALKRDHGTGVIVDLGLAAPADEHVRAAIRSVPGVTLVDDAPPEPDGRRDRTTLRIAASASNGMVGAIVAAIAPLATLRDLRVSETTLESVFIALTGRDLRE